MHHGTGKPTLANRQPAAYAAHTKAYLALPKLISPSPTSPNRAIDATNASEGRLLPTAYPMHSQPMPCPTLQYLGLPMQTIPSRTTPGLSRIYFMAFRCMLRICASFATASTFSLRWSSVSSDTRTCFSLYAADRNARPASF